jgi:hypothetical protein
MMNKKGFLKPEIYSIGGSPTIRVFDVFLLMLNSFGNINDSF